MILTFLVGWNVNCVYAVEKSEGKATVVKEGSYSFGNATVLESLAYSFGEAIVRLIGGPWIPPPVPPAPPAPPVAVRFPIERFIIALIIFVAALLIADVSERERRKPKLKRSRRKWRKKIRQPLD